MWWDCFPFAFPFVFASFVAFVSSPSSNFPSAPSPSVRLRKVKKSFFFLLFIIYNHFLIFYFAPRERNTKMWTFRVKTEKEKQNLSTFSLLCTSLREKRRRMETFALLFKMNLVIKLSSLQSNLEMISLISLNVLEPIKRLKHRELPL